MNETAFMRSTHSALSRASFLSAAWFAWFVAVDAFVAVGRFRAVERFEAQGACAGFAGLERNKAEALNPFERAGRLDALFAFTALERFDGLLAL